MAERTPLEDEIIDRFAECPDRLEEVLQGLTESELDLAEVSGSWTIRQHVHHIADGDDLWRTCIKRALGNPNGVFQLDWYIQIPQDGWAEAWHYAERDIQPSMELLRANRKHVVQLLRVIPGALDMPLTVGARDGSEEHARVRDVVEMQTRHVHEHIADIQKILAVHQNKS